MKRIIIAMLLMLAGCQWAAASTDDSDEDLLSLVFLATALLGK